MCLILDANRYGDFFNPDNDDMQPIRQWIKTKGRLVYSPTLSLQRELNNKMKKLLKTDKQRGATKFKIVKSNDVKRKEKELKDNYDLRSNDPHIIALALVGNVKLLVSQDQKLGDDFTKIVKGSIYKTKAHTHLLNQHACR